MCRSVRRFTNAFMPELISIALSTYNGARYLSAQLDSLFAQRGVEIEVVAVDDGSSDDTPEILDKYAARGPLRWSRNPCNLGPTRSFARVLSLCRGSLLAPCDQDDVWHPDKLAVLAAAIGDHDLAYCDSEYVDGSGASMRRRVSTHAAMLEGRQPLPFLFANSVSGHASLLRRELFEAASPFPDGIYHDWWLALCAAGRGGVKYVPEPLVQFRRHDAAFSPVGRAGKRGGNAAAQHWLEYRQRLASAYASRGLRDHEHAAKWADTLHDALDGGHTIPMLRWLWRERRQLPRVSGVPGFNALQLQAQYLKKLHRARATARTK